MPMDMAGPGKLDMMAQMQQLMLLLLLAQMQQGQNPMMGGPPMGMPMGGPSMPGMGGPPMGMGGPPMGEIPPELLMMLMGGGMPPEGMM